MNSVRYIYLSWSINQSNEMKSIDLCKLLNFNQYMNEWWMWKSILLILILWINQNFIRYQWRWHVINYNNNKRKMKMKLFNTHLHTNSIINQVISFFSFLFIRLIEMKKSRYSIYSSSLFVCLCVYVITKYSKK